MKFKDDALVAGTIAVCVLTLWTGPAVAVALLVLVGPMFVIWAIVDRGARDAAQPDHHDPSAGRPRNRWNDPPQA